MNKKEFLLSYIKKKNKGDTIRRTVLIGKIENEFNLYPGYSRQVVDEVLSKQLALGKIERYIQEVFIKSNKSMKELSEYTDEELKEELRRRIVIKMRGVAKNNRTPSWHIWEGIVVNRIEREGSLPRYRIDSQELRDNPEYKHLNKSHFFSLNTDFFVAKKFFPKIGDKVKLRYRITKEKTYSDSTIIIGANEQNLHCVIDLDTNNMIHYGSYKGCVAMLKRNKNSNLKIERYVKNQNQSNGSNN